MWCGKIMQEWEYRYEFQDLQKKMGLNQGLRDNKEWGQRRLWRLTARWRGQYVIHHESNGDHKVTATADISAFMPVQTGQNLHECDSRLTGDKKGILQIIASKNGYVSFLTVICTQDMLLEIHPLPNKFNLSLHLTLGMGKAGWKHKWSCLVTKKFIYSKVAYIFPYVGVTIFSKNLGT